MQKYKLIGRYVSVFSLFCGDTQLMQITDYINTDLKPLEALQKVSEVKKAFKKNSLTHLPVVSGNHWMGLMPNEDLSDLDDNMHLSDYEYLLEHFFVKENTGWLDVLGGFVKNETNLMPLVNHQNQYLGYYALEDVLDLFYDTPFLKEEGHLIEISMHSKEYSMSKICQITEANNARLLGAMVSGFDVEHVRVTLKVNQTAVNPLLQTFRRYGFEIVSEHDEDRLMSNLKERSEYLKRYLNI